MNALSLTLFVSSILGGMFVLLFVMGVKDKSHQHIDRLSLLPLADDGAPQAAEATPDIKEAHQAPSEVRHERS